MKRTARLPLIGGAAAFSGQKAHHHAGVEVVVAGPLARQRRGKHRVEPTDQEGGLAQLLVLHRMGLVERGDKGKQVRPRRPWR
ncbi:hypothetical protein LP419_38315 [Massilia sp. H-1]|nr:hypothetical protein LP419_38315 [Massilia sp. H-1]